MDQCVNNKPQNCAGCGAVVQGGSAEIYMQSQFISTEATKQITPRGAENQGEFNDLDRDIKPFDLLRLIRDVGHQVGLSGGDIQHLDYLISHTKGVDWEVGQRPIIYKSVCKMARERGVSERQIHHREAKLHALGCLIWNDMGNFRRTGGRNKSGRIVFAYGVDLSPLASRYDEFAALKEQQSLDLAAFDDARRRTSSIRRRILVKITQAQDYGLEVVDIVRQFAALPRVHARTSSDALEAILARAGELETALEDILSSCGFSTHCMGLPACGLNQKTSDQAEENFRHIQPTNNPQSSKDDTCNRGVTDDRKNVGKKSPASGTSVATISTGAEHLSPRQVIRAASEIFIAYIQPTGRKVSMSDVVDAAALRCRSLGIHKTAWTEACSAMGGESAAIAVIIIDRNLNHPETPIKNPGGVLRAMTARAQIGELHLHRSIFGILDRDAQGGGIL